MEFPGKHATFDQAVSHVRAGELEKAEAVCKQLLKHNKRDADAYQVRGSIAMKRQDYAEAAKHYARCLSIKPREAHYHFLAGRVAVLRGSNAEARRKLDRALQLKPGYEPAVEWKAKFLEFNGEHDQARALLEPFIAEGRENAGMAEVQARIETHDGRYLEAAAIAERHLQRADLPDDARHRLGHIVGSAYEKAGEYDKAFAAHTAASRAVEVLFDRGTFTRGVNRLIDVYTADFVGALTRHGNRSRLPVFIAGMPRSGTTLVEQIIDAHPQAFGAGEIQDFDTIADGLQIEAEATEPRLRSAIDLDGEDVARLSKQYLDSLRRISRTAKRVVNKSLDNYRNLGLVGVLFPAAPVIHCSRDPRDTCISCYMSTIMPKAYPWVSDLSDLGFAYVQYQRLIAHWRQVIPQPILEVGYEALVDDVEGQSRRIIEFLGLDWDDACLRFYASGRMVRTASYEQVRQPIYRTSIGRYRRYERHLGPLLEALAADSG